MPAQKVLMIEPGNFYSNPQTAFDNFFQHETKNSSPEEINASAFKEFDSLVDKLTVAGIDVTVIRKDDDRKTPDAVFPNNWFSTHPDGTLVLYPMNAANRRLERRPGIISQLEKRYPRLIDLTFHEKNNAFLEGTGSLVIDHANSIAYASLSQRTDLSVLKNWSEAMNHQLVTFTSYDKNQQTIYHTNVMMCLGDAFAIVCLEAIRSDDEKNEVQSKLESTHHEIIEISLEQMHHFCGNCLVIENKSGKKFLVMSDNAYNHFTKDQLQTIETFCTIIHSNLETFETFGGGGARCMLAELY